MTFAMQSFIWVGAGVALVILLQRRRRIRKTY